MGVTVESLRLYCTVSDLAFGPLCNSDEEAGLLAYHVTRTSGMDPREVGHDSLVEALLELRAGVLTARPTHLSRQCVCGSGLPYLWSRWDQGRMTATGCDFCRAPINPARN